jgi:hypothetical protein
MICAAKKSNPTITKAQKKTPNSRLSSMFCRHSALLQCEWPPRGRRNSRVEEAFLSLSQNSKIKMKPKQNKSVDAAPNFRWWTSVAMLAERPKVNEQQSLSE